MIARIVSAVALAALLGALSTSAASGERSTWLAVQQFCGDEHNDCTRIFVARSDGSGARLLVDGGHRPAWSPDGAWVAFDDLDGIAVVRADGSGRRRVVSKDVYGAPRWSPDGRRIVFEQMSAAPAIVAVNGGARKVLPLPAGAESARQPDWAPDGRRIAFTANFGEDRSDPIYVVNADGTGLRKLTDPPSGGSDFNARWSPDGKRLLFVRGGLKRDASGRWLQLVYRVSAGGGQPKILFRQTVLSASWSPDGRRIAYAGGPVGIKVHVFDLARRTDRTLPLAACRRMTCHFVDWER